MGVCAVKLGAGNHMCGMIGCGHIYWIVCCMWCGWMHRIMTACEVMGSWGWVQCVVCPSCENNCKCGGGCLFAGNTGGIVWVWLCPRGV